MHVIFFEIRPIEELQDPKSSPRREEVGRHTLRDYGGFLPAFFYRASFGLLTQQIPLFVDEPQKLSHGAPSLELLSVAPVPSALCLRIRTQYPLSTVLFLLYRFLPIFTDFSDFLVSVLPGVLFTG